MSFGLTYLYSWVGHKQLGATHVSIEYVTVDSQVLKSISGTFFFVFNLHREWTHLLKSTYNITAAPILSSIPHFRRTQLHITLINKENKFFLIYQEIQSGAVAKSYMRKGVLIYEKMHKYFPIYEEAVRYIGLCNCSILNFRIYEENLIFFFISVRYNDFTRNNLVVPGHSWLQTLVQRHVYKICVFRLCQPNVD
jgi:hypothetical protein